MGATLLACLCLSAESVLAALIFSDEFSGTAVDATKWAYPTGPESYIPITQMRAAYPPVSNGFLWLRLDTYNPTAIIPGDSFYGSEIFTRQLFPRGSGLRAEVCARLVAPTVGGLVGGMFFYRSFEQTTLHSEIDFELLSNYLDKALTNVYANEPSGVGHPIFVPVADTTRCHVYTIDWVRESVRWYIDGVLMRVETTVKPSEDLAFHLNFWAPACSYWPMACNPNLSPAENSADSKTFYFAVDWVRISGIDDDVPASLPSWGGWRAILK
jgi:hypothetical protein